jgi:uncharacterized protein YcbK (DUF882 family)
VTGGPAATIGTLMLCLLAGACTPSGGSLATDTAGNPIAPTIPGIMAEVASQGRQAPGAAPQTGAASLAAGTPQAIATAASPASPVVETTPGADVALPEQVNSVPTSNPVAPVVAMQAPAPATPAETSAGEAQPAADSDALVQSIMAAVPAPVPMPRPSIAEDETAPADQASAVTAFATPAKPVQPEKKGFFALLFGGASAAQKAPAPQPAASPAPAEAPQPTPEAAAVPVPSAPPVTQAHVMEEGVRPLIDENAPAKPIVQLVSAEAPASPLATSGPARAPSGSYDALPGVRGPSALFEITRKSGTGDDSDVDISEDDNAPVRVASAAGLARLDPHGFLLQRQTVDTACLKPGLIAILRKIEQHFGHKLIVTSGYRSPVHNAAAHGALNSLHMFCAAADVQMPDVSKWQLARYARSLPGRGGVGTYCYTDSVHIDIGPERDWNWRCRRRHRRH